MLDKKLSKIGDRLFLIRDRFEKFRDRVLYNSLGVTPGRFHTAGELRASITRSFSPANLRKSRIVPAAVVFAALVLTAKMSMPGGALAKSGEAAKAGAKNSGVVYFFDLNTGLLFNGAVGTQGPIAAPSNAAEPDSSPAGVRAYVYSCGQCGDAEKQYIGYLEMYAPGVPGAPATPGTASAQPEPGAKLPPGGALLHDAHRQLVAKPSLDPEWQPAASEAGKSIISGGRKKCSDNRFPAHCLPQ